MALKVQVTNRIFPVQPDTNWSKKDGGRLDFTLGLKRGKQIGSQIKQIMDAIRPALAYTLGYDSNMDMHEFIKSSQGQMFVRLMQERFYQPGSYLPSKCDELGTQIVRQMWANSWDCRDIILTGLLTIDQIVWPSSNEVSVIIQNKSVANVCFIGWSAIVATGMIELQPKQIIQIPNARAAMYGVGTAGQIISTQRGGF